jgi:hypothetical protein
MKQTKDARNKTCAVKGVRAHASRLELAALWNRFTGGASPELALVLRKWKLANI